MIIKRLPNSQYSVIYEINGKTYEQTDEDRKICIKKALAHIQDSIDELKEVEDVETIHQLYINKRGLSTSHRANLSDIRIYLDSENDSKELTRILVNRNNALRSAERKIAKLEKEILELLERIHG